MNSQKRIAGWFTAALMSAAAVATAPYLFGGGGDEGVDILPFAASQASNTVPAKPKLGYITIERTSKLTWDDKATWFHSGVIIGPHQMGDVLVGHIGHEPWPGMTSIDVFAKGTHHLSFGQVGGAVHIDGRFEMVDLDPRDGEVLTLVGNWSMPALGVFVVGTRATHNGAIAKSFAQIDHFEIVALARGLIDLNKLRMQSVLALGGTGRDVAAGIILVGPSDNLIQSWAAFNVDDASALYDVENKGD